MSDQFLLLYVDEGVTKNRAKLKNIPHFALPAHRTVGDLTNDQQSFWEKLAEVMLQAHQMLDAKKKTAWLSLALDVKQYPIDWLGEVARHEIGHTTLPGIIFLETHSTKLTVEEWLFLATKDCRMVVLELGEEERST